MAYSVLSLTQDRKISEIERPKIKRSSSEPLINTAENIQKYSLISNSFDNLNSAKNEIRNDRSGKSRKFFICDLSDKLPNTIIDSNSSQGIKSSPPHPPPHKYIPGSQDSSITCNTSFILENPELSKSVPSLYPNLYREVVFLDECENVENEFPTGPVKSEDEVLDSNNLFGSFEMKSSDNSYTEQSLKTGNKPPITKVNLNDSRQNTDCKQNYKQNDTSDARKEVKNSDGKEPFYAKGSQAIKSSLLNFSQKMIIKPWQKYTTYNGPGYTKNSNELSVASSSFREKSYEGSKNNVSIPDRSNSAKSKKTSKNNSQQLTRCRSETSHIKNKVPPNKTKNLNFPKTKKPENGLTKNRKKQTNTDFSTKIPSLTLSSRAKKTKNQSPSSHIPNTQAPITDNEGSSITISSNSTRVVNRVVDQSPWRKLSNKVKIQFKNTNDFRMAYENVTQNLQLGQEHLLQSSYKSASKYFESALEIMDDILETSVRDLKLSELDATLCKSIQDVITSVDRRKALEGFSDCQAGIIPPKSLNPSTSKTSPPTYSDVLENDLKNNFLGNENSLDTSVKNKFKRRCSPPPQNTLFASSSSATLTQIPHSEMLPTEDPPVYTEFEEETPKKDIYGAITSTARNAQLPLMKPKICGVVIKQTYDDKSKGERETKSMHVSNTLKYFGAVNQQKFNNDYSTEQLVALSNKNINIDVIHPSQSSKCNDSLSENFYSSECQDRTNLQTLSPTLEISTETLNDCFKDKASKNIDIKKYSKPNECSSNEINAVSISKKHSKDLHYSFNGNFSHNLQELSLFNTFVRDGSTNLDTSWPISKCSEKTKLAIPMKSNPEIDIKYLIHEEKSKTSNKSLYGTSSKSQRGVSDCIPNTSELKSIYINDSPKDISSETPHANSETKFLPTDKESHVNDIPSMIHSFSHPNLAISSLTEESPYDHSNDKSFDNQSTPRSICSSSIPVIPKRNSNIHTKLNIDFPSNIEMYSVKSEVGTEDDKVINMNKNADPKFDQDENGLYFATANKLSDINNDQNVNNTHPVPAPRKKFLQRNKRLTKNSKNETHKTTRISPKEYNKCDSQKTIAKKPKVTDGYSAKDTVTSHTHNLMTSDKEICNTTEEHQTTNNFGDDFSKDSSLHCFERTKLNPVSNQIIRDEHTKIPNSDFENTSFIRSNFVLDPFLFEDPFENHGISEASTTPKDIFPEASKSSLTSIEANFPSGSSSYQNIKNEDEDNISNSPTDNNEERHLNYYHANFPFTNEANSSENMLSKSKGFQNNSNIEYFDGGILTPSLTCNTSQPHVGLQESILSEFDPIINVNSQKLSENKDIENQDGLDNFRKEKELQKYLTENCFIYANEDELRRRTEDDVDILNSLRPTKETYNKTENTLEDSTKQKHLASPLTSRTKENVLEKFSKKHFEDMFSTASMKYSKLELGLKKGMGNIYSLNQTPFGKKTRKQAKNKSLKIDNSEFYTGPNNSSSDSLNEEWKEILKFDGIIFYIIKENGQVASPSASPVMRVLEEIPVETDVKSLAIKIEVHLTDNLIWSHELCPDNSKALRTQQEIFLIMDDKGFSCVGFQFCSATDRSQISQFTNIISENAFFQVEPPIIAMQQKHIIKDNKSEKIIIGKINGNQNEEIQKKNNDNLQTCKESTKKLKKIQNSLERAMAGKEIFHF